ncbi:amino acid ABC transporter permease [Cypionkella sinensis]|uniref:Amino acid ABC transporter permease n=1 Tax=Cypionkella sinensis TaxID=1756043 RepID=A0ABV7IYE3_9RHOB
MALLYVRKDMVAPQAPPASQSGAIRWVRDNLFKGPFNTILTLLAAWVLFELVSLSWPWLANGVWSGANSMADCRAAVAAKAGPDASGACWAMIRERWPQFIFGFYPPELWWRPILTFGLLFVALAPVLYADNKSAMSKLCGVVGVLTVICVSLTAEELFTDPAILLTKPAIVITDPMVDHSKLVIALVAALMLVCTGIAAIRPRLLLGITLFFPFLALWMMWGGSIWGPITAMLGFVVMVVVYGFVAPKLGPVMGASLGFLSACLWWLFLQSYVSESWQGLLPFDLVYVPSDKFGGFLLAFVIGVSSISISLPLGILLALGRRSDMFLVKTLSVGFIEFVRGVPLITMLFTASLLLQYFLPPQTKFDLILRVVILVTIFSAAYNAEVVRGGLAALPRGQYEAADALGLDYWQAQRLIIMPQALKISIPGIVSTFIGLFKDTTLVSFVGLADPLRGITTIVRADIAWKGIYWEPYIFVGAIFFLVCFGMSRYSMYLENKLKTDHR